MVICDAPGIPKDRIKVQVKENRIFIEGKRKKKVISNEDSYLIEERRNGPFKKMLQMPLDADTQKMTAKMEDGLLVLTVPRVSSIEGAKTINIA